MRWWAADVVENGLVPKLLNLRNDVSASLVTRAVSSMRVPVFGRKWRRSWPASRNGKKSCPDVGGQKACQAETRKPGEDRPVIQAQLQ